MPKSLHGQYIEERENAHILEYEDQGFITYKFINDEECYLIDIFVTKELRKTGLGIELTDKACMIAKTAGCKRVVGTVAPGAVTATDSLRLLIQYGFKIHSASPQLIILKKDLE